MLEGKKVLVAGLAISGVASVKALSKLGASVVVTDMKSSEELKEEIEQLDGIQVEYVLGSNDVDLKGIELVLKSPGIPYDIELFQKARSLGIEVITDIELAERVRKAEFICVTGTNGKTTTTSLIGDIFRKSGKKTYVVGNIGVGILSELEALRDPESVFVIEASSFQLEDTVEFKPEISLLTNITPDHLNWHGSLENYISSKKKIYRNQGSGDYTVLNYEDEVLRDASSEISSNAVYFSAKRKLEKGCFIEDGRVVFSDGSLKRDIMKVSDIKIPGDHNLENVLSAVAVALSYGIPPEVVESAVSEFEGVEHRLEFVAEVEGARYYNDSKGTNPDASIKAVEAIPSPIILIAGGMDKGGEFDDFVESFGGKVKSLVLLGETAEKIKAEAVKSGIEDIHLVSGIEEAVDKAHRISTEGDNVLLSPACASWDMYPSYEIRGRLFKEAVYRIKEA
ncbi:UDP-N-acetylmuramoylalanine--D-glutamate ligase [Andreesenia angusta]|uniref:UDP-N-acetylmuramoylalanine--D-glutamate ligase n=1 Tax=Andreesenia angusta TaxID=39480 RepID=A0A1S1V8W0_9FIRM|nr:UDP-N-acetylmuramoyl-L-alanine--D-glutamate ligase [Andreesenia angusta]OHW63032.1 UDP-N-acetylmuramoylalanine--D-glutamate ligase [Andreesenia angusta]